MLFSFYSNFSETEYLDSDSLKDRKGLGLIETRSKCEYVNTNSRTATTGSGFYMTSKINIGWVRQCDASNICSFDAVTILKRLAAFASLWNRSLKSIFKTWF